MPAFIKSVTFDCRDPLVIAEFWAAALGSNVDEDSTPERAWVEAMGDLEEERERLVALGATVQGGGGDPLVMLDEGNEFCLEN